MQVRLKGGGKNILLFRNNDIWIRGDVRLEAAGPVETMKISGETSITGGYYTKNIDLLGMIGSSSGPVTEGVNFLFSFPEPPFRNAVFDIRITSSEPFRIRNNLVRSSLRPDLTLKGTGELPYLIGAVYIDPSRILLPAGRLQVQSGLLRFRENEPDRPQLDLLASSKILDYDINVLTQGPIDEPIITLSSRPPLPNEDLLLLLLTGQPPQKGTSAGAQGTGTRNVLVYISRDFLNKWLEEDIGSSDDTILDRFELDYGRGITRSGEQTFESTFRLSDTSGGTGQAYYLTGEKDRYDAYNYGLKMVFRFE
jgi:translocation and assembly module TamB